MNRAQIYAEDILRIIAFILRIIAFFVGLGLLISGFIDLGRLSSVEVLTVLSIGGTALLKIIVGAFLMLAGISPNSVRMIIKVLIRGYSVFGMV